MGPLWKRSFESVSRVQAWRLPSPSFDGCLDAMEIAMQDGNSEMAATVLLFHLGAPLAKAASTTWPLVIHCPTKTGIPGKDVPSPKG